MIDFILSSYLAEDSFFYIEKNIFMAYDGVDKEAETETPKYKDEFRRTI